MTATAQRLGAIVVLTTAVIVSGGPAFVSPPPFSPAASRIASSTTCAGNLHGEGSCFMPLVQLDSEYVAPRIVRVAGMYPGLTASELAAPSSDDPAPTGQWTYDFSDPDGPQMGTVAFEGGQVVCGCVDAVVIVCEHTALGVPLPDALTEPADLVALIDRSKTGFVERKFLVTSSGPDAAIEIGAYNAMSEMPAGSSIVGHVQLVQIPWLPCMKTKKTGFAEENEYF